MNIHALVDDLADSHDQYLIRQHAAKPGAYSSANDTIALEILQKKALLYVGLLQIATHLEHRVWECEQGFENLWAGINHINLIYVACLTAQEQDPENPIIAKRRKEIEPFKASFDELSSLRAQVKKAVSELETKTMTHPELALCEKRLSALRSALVDNCRSLLEQSHGKM